MFCRQLRTAAHQTEGTREAKRVKKAKLAQFQTFDIVLFYYSSAELDISGYKLLANVCVCVIVRVCMCVCLCEAAADFPGKAPSACQGGD